MIEEFNMESKAECGQLNLAHLARNKIKCIKKKLKQTNASAHSVRYRLRSMKAVQKEPERLWKKGNTMNID